MVEIDHQDEQISADGLVITSQECSGDLDIGLQENDGSLIASRPDGNHLHQNGEEESDCSHNSVKFTLWTSTISNGLLGDREKVAENDTSIKVRNESIVHSFRSSARMRKYYGNTRSSVKSSVIMQSLVAASFDDGFLGDFEDGTEDDTKDESKGESSAFDAESEALPFVLIALSICQYFSSGIISCTPSVFSAQFQDQLNVSSSVYGTAFAISKIGSLVAALISPKLIQRYGGFRPLLCMGALFICGSLFFSLSYNAESYELFVFGLLILNIASVFNYLIASTIMGMSITDKDTFRILKMTLTTFMSLGDILGSFIFPRLGIVISLWLFVFISLLNVLVTIYLEYMSIKKGTSQTYQEIQNELNDMNRSEETMEGPISKRDDNSSECKSSQIFTKQIKILIGEVVEFFKEFIRELKEFPMIYWLLVFESTFVAGFSVYMNFSIYALSEIYGLDVIQANQIVGTGKTMKLFILVPYSLLMKKFKWIEKPTVLAVPILLIFSCLPILLRFSLWRAWVEYISLGLAIALSNLVSRGLIVPALRSEGKLDLITTGSGHLMVLSSVWSAISSQLYYSIMEYTVIRGDIEFHPGYLFNLSMGIIILVIAVYVFYRLPLEKTHPKPVVHAD